jgi:hypothetical protein
VKALNTGTIPKQILLHQPRGQRSVRHPTKRWEENMRERKSPPGLILGRRRRRRGNE